MVAPASPIPIDSATGRIAFAPPAAPLSFNLAFVVGRLQSMLAGDACNCRDQRHPSACRFDFIEAQQQVRMQSVAYGAYVTLDPAVARDDAFVGPDQVFQQFRFKAFSRLNPAGVQLLFQADQKRGSVRDGMRGRRGIRLLRR